MAIPGSTWPVAWTLVLCGFASGVVLGLFFHRDAFLGGYGSFARRLARLGHVACVMLGVLLMLFELSPAGASGSDLAAASRALWCAGAVAMPATCFLTAWRPSLRHLFAAPALCLVAAASATLALL